MTKKGPDGYSSAAMKILLLCKVVDNYGDIGFAYRLARSLSALDGSLELTLAVSDLASFSRLAPELDATLPLQRYRGWDVLDASDGAASAAYCASHGLEVVLECLQCGRPDWLDDYLFGGGLPGGQQVQVVNVEYLTAEDWAEDFHLLKGGTRSPNVRKLNFLPGFTGRTGGLLLDGPFLELLADRKLAVGRVLSIPALAGFDPAACNVLVFSYERDFAPVVRAFSRFHASCASLGVYLAPGRGAGPFLSAYRGEGCPFPLVELPYLAQEDWDALLASCDVAFVRGEESFSRSCLSSRPFVWQAYRQEGAFHLVKLSALLERMRGCFLPEEFSELAEFFLLYNIDDTVAAGGGPSAEALEAVGRLCPPLARHLAGEGGRLREAVRGLAARTEELTLAFLEGRERLAAPYARFSSSLLANGDLAAKLLACLREICPHPVAIK